MKLKDYQHVLKGRDYFYRNYQKFSKNQYLDPKIFITD